MVDTLQTVVVPVVDGVVMVQVFGYAYGQELDEPSAMIT